MSYVADKLKQMQDVRRRLRRCIHVEQGAHPTAKWAMGDYDLLLCSVCDSKMEQGNNTPLVFCK